MRYVSRIFNAKTEDQFKLDERKCPLCKRFNLVVENGFEFCSDGNCKYVKALASEEDNEGYDGVI